MGNLGSFPGHLRASPWAPPRPWDLALSIFRCGTNFSCPRVFLATPRACLGTPGASPGQHRECAGPVFHLEAQPPAPPQQEGEAAFGRRARLGASPRTKRGRPGPRPRLRPPPQPDHEEPALSLARDGSGGLRPSGCFRGLDQGRSQRLRARTLPQGPPLGEEEGGAPPRGSESGRRTCEVSQLATWSASAAPGPGLGRPPAAKAAPTLTA